MCTLIAMGGGGCHFRYKSACVYFDSHGGEEGVIFVINLPECTLIAMGGDYLKPTPIIYLVFERNDQFIILDTTECLPNHITFFDFIYPLCCL